MKKVANDCKIDDDDDMNECALWADKVYQSIEEYIRAVHHNKKPINSALDPSEKCFNEQVARTRVVAENYFCLRTELEDFVRQIYLG